VVPKAIEVRAQRLDARGVQFVESAVSIGPIDDQMGVLQDSQVLGDRRPGDRKAPGELADRLRPVQQPLEDGSAGRIAEGVQLLGVLVNNH